MPPKSTYLKPHLTIEQQIQKLKTKNIEIDNLNKAKHSLSHLNYYRLSAYWKAYPYKIKFQKILNDYFFDKELRLLILSAIESIEISLKTQISFILTSKYGIHPNLKSILDEKYDIQKFKEEYNRNNEEFIKHFKEKYKEPLPPMWIMVEIISFGQLSMMYKCIKERKDRNAISHKYGLDSSILQLYIHQLTIIRNISAHHGRLWNKKFTLNLKIPKAGKIANSSEKRGYKNKKIYNSLVFLKYMLDIIEPLHSWDIKLKELIRKYDINIDFMGFPLKWDLLPVWR